MENRKRMDYNVNVNSLPLHLNDPELKRNTTVYGAVIGEIKNPKKLAT